MPWRDVYLTLQGLRQKEEPFRALGQVLVDIWSSKPTKIKNHWILPFDAPGEHESTFERLKQRQRELNQLKQNGSNGTT